MTVRRAALGMAVLAALAACGSDPPPIKVRKTESTVTYSCENGRALQALFRAGEPAVTLTIEGQTLVLPQVPSGSGIAFSDGSLTFRAKGQEAFTEGWPAGDYLGCVQDG